MYSVPTTEAIDEATLAVRRERRELTDEKQAFEAFLERVKRLETDQTHRSRSQLVLADRSGLETVLDAYLETVMSVPHYADQHDETPLEHLAGELTPELGAAIGSGTQLHPMLKRSLLDAGQQAVTARADVLEWIRTESNALEQAERKLAALLDELESVLGQPLEQLEFNALRLTRDRLERLQRSCDELARWRQEALHRYPIALTDVGDLVGYLYEDCASRHPVLATVAQLGTVLEDVLRWVDRRLCESR